MTGEHGERACTPGSPDEPVGPSPHPDLDTLSLWAADAPATDPTVDAVVADHVAACAGCAREVEALAGVQALLAAQPTPRMPVDVAARLNDVIAMESASRIAVGSGGTTKGRGAPPPRTAGPETLAPVTQPVHGDPHPRPVLGRLADGRGAGRSRRLGRVVGGLVLAGVLGCAGYVLSASVGLNEPTAVNPVSVDPATLKSEAVTVEHDDLSPHRFSRAWRCAREVTDGSITGIRPVVVAGALSYLVFTSDDGEAAATLVTGCAEGRPRVGGSVALPRR